VNIGNSPNFVITIPRGYVFDDVAISMGVGNLQIESLEARTFTLEGGVGSVIVDKLHSNRTMVDMGIGSVTLRLRGKYENYYLDIDTGIGSVIINGRKHSGGKYGDKSAASYLTVNGGIGEVNATFDGEDIIPLGPNETGYGYDRNITSIINEDAEVQDIGVETGSW